jgi:hypothetical protein
MRLLSFFRIEISRIFRSKVTWLFIILTAATPLFGFTIFKLNDIETASSQMIINPVLSGTIGASVLFALFTLFELDKVNKYKTSMLTDAAASAMALHTARMGAIFAASVVTGFLTVLAYLPLTMIKISAFFDPWLFLSSYLIFMIPGMWIGSLFAAIFYQLSRRTDISFVLVAACVLLSFSGFLADDFILRWINPNLPVFSDGFGNIKPLRMGLYNRLFWLMLLGGAWFLSLIFTRKYEKGMFGSALYNIRKLYLPAIGVVLILLSVRHYLHQPFYNNAPPEVDWNALYDTGAILDYSSISAEVKPDFARGIMHGKITYKISSLSKEAVKKRLIINSGYTISRISINGEAITYKDLGDDNFVAKHIEFDVPYGNNMELAIEYGGYPKLWGAYKTNLGGAEISRSNIELWNYSLIPSLGAYGIPVNVSIVIPDSLTLLSVENCVDGVIDNGDGTKTWNLTNEYDYMDIYASDYSCKVVHADKMTVEFYFHKNFTDLLEENNIDEVLTDVFNYCTQHFGPLNYLENNTLRLVQTSAFNFGGGATPGMSNMGETTFSIQSLSDPRKGAAGKEILAHEIIHQWWGLNRMIWDSEDMPEWTAEGLTVYSTYRLYKEKYGDEYGQKNYVAKWKAAVEEMNRNFYHRHPEYLKIMPENFAARIRVRELEVAKYSLMPLMIYKAAELVGGEEAMDRILTKLSGSNPGEQLTYQEFLDACGLTREVLVID